MRLENRKVRHLEGLGHLSYVEVSGTPEVALVQGKRVVVLAVGEEAIRLFHQATADEVLAQLERAREVEAW